jgi:predicted F0F1-ATPase subunit
MSDPERDPLSRDDARRRTERDLARLRNRAPDGGFWRALGLIGSVGWPIALLTIGGALAGRSLDTRWHTGVRLTFMLLSLGAGIGSWLAWRGVHGSNR